MVCKKIISAIRGAFLPNCFARGNSDTAHGIVANIANIIIISAGKPAQMPAVTIIAGNIMSFIRMATKRGAIRAALEEGASPAPTHSNNKLRAPLTINSKVNVANVGRAISK